MKMTLSTGDMVARIESHDTVSQQVEVARSEPGSIILRLTHEYFNPQMIVEGTEWRVVQVSGLEKGTPKVTIRKPDNGPAWME